MKHIADIELIEFVAGRLDDGQAAALRRHVEQCPLCTERLREFDQTWRMLGAWQVPVDGHSVPGRGSVATPQAQVPTIWRLRRDDSLTFLKIAAAVAIVAVGGYSAGRWTAKPKASMPTADVPHYLSVLASDSADSLSQLILTEDSVPGEGT